MLSVISNHRRHFCFFTFLWFNIVYIYNSVEVNMIFGSTVGYDSIYSYPYESRKITVQEMMENIPLYDSEKEKAVMKEQKIEKYVTLQKVSPKL